MATFKQISSNALRSIISRVNTLWASLFTSNTKTTLVDADEVLIKDSEDSSNFKKSTLSNIKDYIGSVASGYWEDSDTALYPIESSRDLAAGGNAKATAPFFYDVSTGKLKLNTVVGSGASSLVLVSNPNIVSNSCFTVQGLPLSTDLDTGKAFQFMVSGEIKARGMFYSDGSYFMGDGTNTRDVGWIRSDTNTVEIASDKLSGTAHLDVTGNIITGGYIKFGDTVDVRSNDNKILVLGGATSELVAIGFDSGEYNTSTSNTFIGYQSGQGVDGSSTGGLNTALGFRSLYGLTTGTDNYGIGLYAMSSLSTGSRNLALGRYTAGTLTTGSDNLIIGQWVDVDNVADSNIFRLGSGVVYLLEGYMQAGSVWVGTSVEVRMNEIKEYTTDNGVDIDGVKMKDSFIELDEMTAPSNPAANKGRLYVADNAGTTSLYFKDSTGAVTQIV